MGLESYFQIPSFHFQSFTSTPVLMGSHGRDYLNKAARLIIHHCIDTKIERRMRGQDGSIYQVPSYSSQGSNLGE